MRQLELRNISVYSWQPTNSKLWALYCQKSSLIATIDK